MADSEIITVPLRLPRDEAVALARFVRRIPYDTVADVSSVFNCIYGGRAECDVMWMALGLLRGALAQAGFA